jgi:S-adenosylmethionine hydrolase
MCVSNLVPETLTIQIIWLNGAKAISKRWIAGVMKNRILMQQVSSPLCPPVAFLTDFGLRDGYVGVLKGVVLSILPQAQLIDITHDIPPQDIAAGAWVLGASYRYFPSGTVYTCVVDPGVGSARQPIAVHAGDWFFVGPDNGLLSYILTEQPVHKAIALSNPAYHLPQVSATFQGRDVFAPVAAHLARGVTLGDLGTPLDPSDLKLLDLKYASRQDGQITAQIVYIDHFGNLISNISAHLVPDLFTCASIQLTFPSQGTVVTERRHFFADNSAQNELAAGPFIYIDSSGYVGVARQNGNAAATLGIRVGDAFILQIGPKK